MLIDVIHLCVVVRQIMIHIVPQVENIIAPSSIEDGVALESCVRFAVSFAIWYLDMLK